jgi:hypothetical protein
MEVPEDIQSGERNYQFVTDSEKLEKIFSMSHEDLQLSTVAQRRVRMWLTMLGDDQKYVREEARAALEIMSIAGVVDDVLFTLLTEYFEFKQLMDGV